MKIIIVTLLIWSLMSCGQLSHKNIIEKVSSSPNSNIIQFDTTRVAMIPFNKEAFEIFRIFDSTFNPASLTQDDLHEIDSLLIECVSGYNNSLDEGNKKFPAIDLHNYKIQLIAVTNDKGEKEVWVNCFCEMSDNWKTQIIAVEDGGSYFFNFKLNITTKKYYNFMTYGIA